MPLSSVASLLGYADICVGLISLLLGQV